MRSAATGQPPGILKAVEALEVSSRFVPDQGYRRRLQLRSWNSIVGGDAHCLKEMQRRILFMMEGPGIKESRLALRRVGWGVK